MATDAAVLSELPDGTLRLLAWLMGLLGSRRQPRSLRATHIAAVNQTLAGCPGALSSSVIGPCLLASHSLDRHVQHVASGTDVLLC